MEKIFFEALIDTLKIVPLLLAIYFLIELFEFKYSEKLVEKVEKAGNAGPGLGAILGSLPQCGFSVISTALYTRKLLTIGTLIAVYIATSDEAIPIILANPSKASFVVPILVTKIAIALIVGYLIDFIYKKYNKTALKHISHLDKNDFCDEHHEKHSIDETACCGHSPEETNLREILIHPLIHTGKIALFILATTFLIGILFNKVDNGLLEKIFLGNSIFQPFIAGIIGLIPNCASSVALSELFMKGVIGFGSLIAGLSTSAGLGLIILFREDKNRKDVLRIVGILLLVSVLSGILIQLFYK